MKSVCILGSTGSIGTQTLQVIAEMRERFQVHTLVAGSNIELLSQQAKAFNVKRVIVGDESKIAPLRELLAGSSTEVAGGADASSQCVSESDIDIVIAAIVGIDGLRPVFEACKAGKRIGLANKETLVVAGELIMATARANGAEIIPVDSEHSAIFQCLTGEQPEQIEKLILTASGGPFRDKDPGSFKSITKAEALNHPNWDMGPKITIDSATMMNKGLEVIEARWLFDQSVDKIEVVIHPQSIIHSMVQFVDASTKAQLGVPDMKVPIQYALSYPDRIESDFPRLDWSQVGSLDFKAPDKKRFPCLFLAFEALAKGGSATTTLNASNEEAVALFLREEISFLEIPQLVEGALEKVAHDREVLEIEHFEEIDRRSRVYIKELRNGKGY